MGCMKHKSKYKDTSVVHSRENKVGKSYERYPCD